MKQYNFMSNSFKQIRGLVLCGYENCLNGYWLYFTCNEIVNDRIKFGDEKIFPVEMRRYIV